MDQTVVIDIGRQALSVVFSLTAPILGFSLLTGLLVAILQATTQIQEQTLAFIPKIIAVLVSLAIFGPWMLSTLVDYVTNLYNSIPQYLG